MCLSCSLGGDLVEVKNDRSGCIVGESEVCEFACGIM